MTNEELCLLIQHGSDKKSYMEQLYLQNKGLIAQVAKKYCGYAEIEDLLQEGYFGLLKAAESFDDTKGANFVTHAYEHIRAVIHRYIEDNSNTIRIPSAQRALILKMKRYIDEYVKKYSQRPSVEEMAKAL
ncbi:MAG: sigma-70 family RNA polymerase sigma factor, partial [Methanobrevibacter sp.]|nr:sigma-70 family RNA polymerase sigma factor [Methanobrevibacter sp.]